MAEAACVVGPWGFLPKPREAKEGYRLVASPGLLGPLRAEVFPCETSDIFASLPPPTSPPRLRRRGRDCLPTQ